MIHTLSSNDKDSGTSYIYIYIYGNITYSFHTHLVMAEIFWWMLDQHTMDLLCPYSKIVCMEWESGWKQTENQFTGHANGGYLKIRTNREKRNLSGKIYEYSFDFFVQLQNNLFKPFELRGKSFERFDFSLRILFFFEQNVISTEIRIYTVLKRGIMTMKRVCRTYKNTRLLHQEQNYKAIYLSTYNYHFDQKKIKESVKLHFIVHPIQVHK